MSERKTRKNQRSTFAIISLGCPKNLVDSESIAGLLTAAGHQMVSEPEDADLVVINTCGFIADARTESYQTIKEMLRLKKRGQVNTILVAGCLAERDKEKLLEKYPEIDLVVGVFARDEIATLVGKLASGQQGMNKAVFRPPASCPPPDINRQRLTLGHLAYLKIAEGCNRLCSFCSIPIMRGPFASKPIEQIVEEAKELAAQGVRELIVVAQDTTFYGLDIYNRPRLADLLQRLEEVEHLRWIRVMYAYPMHVTDELIEVLGSGRKVLPYLDMPLQHISDRILDRMRRRVGRIETEQLLDRLRERIPSLILRTTLMTGFPGETEADFQELLEFVERQRFERLGVFAYCNEPDTLADRLDDQLPEEIRLQRRDILMAAQQKIAFAWNENQVGKLLKVMIDCRVPGEASAYVGRTYADAPEIDGQVYVTGENLLPGQIVSCEIVATKGYDLIGVVSSQEATR